MIDELLKHCKNVISLLEQNYSRQINYNGIIKEVYIKFSEMIEKIQNKEISSINIDFFSIIRQFVDDTTEYNSPVIREIEETSRILDKIKARLNL
ncbi:hypothetical protein [Bacillus rhizoplanae]|uniref:hypothetical protein n=1 Tax=Bacillus rhizoplanae TaxID=2880966 RepID=UPI003D22EAE0